MNETQLKDLVRQVVLEILAKQHSAPAEPSRRALVLFTGAWLGFDESIAQLQRLRDDGVHLDIIQTESAKRFLEQDKIASLGPEVTSNLVSTHPMLIIPTLTVNCVATVAHGMADSLATNVIHEFILLNRPIVAVRTAACPDDPEKKSWFPNIPPAFAEVLRKNLAALASFGVTLCNASGLQEAVRSAWHSLEGSSESTQLMDGEASLPEFVSHGMIRNLQQGSVLRITANAIVTHLARDEAAASGVRIIREGA
ncbi:MAG: flavoprotein [Arachnia sp.]